MLIMKVEDYISRMKSIGWSDEHINKLVEMYQNLFQTEDGQIRVLSGDFSEKNLRRYETTF